MELGPLGVSALSAFASVLAAEVNATIQAARDVFNEGGNLSQLVSYLDDLNPILLTIKERHLDSESEHATYLALETLKTKLKKARELIQSMQGRGRLWMLSNCRKIALQVQNVTREIGQSLHFIPLAAVQTNSGVTSKMRELIREMRNAQFVTGRAEERICRALEQQKQGMGALHSDVRQQNYVLTEIAKYMGVPNLPENPVAIRHEIEAIQGELNEARAQKQQAEVEFMEQILELLKSHCPPLPPPPQPLPPPPSEEIPSPGTPEEPPETPSAQPGLLCKSMDGGSSASQRDELPALDAFICPLTKQVMKQPVVIASNRTFEKEAILRWFEEKESQGLPVTCPLTRKALPNTSIKDNFALRQAIEQWTEQNEEIRLRSSYNLLTAENYEQNVDNVLDGLTAMTEDMSINKAKIGREKGLLEALFGCLRVRKSETRLRTLDLLMSLCIDDNMDAMCEQRCIDRLVRCIHQPHTPEAEKSVAILNKMSKSHDACEKIGKASGAILMLVLFKDRAHTDQQCIANANELLQNLQAVDANIEQMLVAGWIDPLLTKMLEGPIEVRARMATMIGSNNLTDENKARAVEQGIVVPLDSLLMSSDDQHKAAALSAIEQLASLPANGSALLKSPNLMPQLCSILFSPSRAKTLEESSASILALLASGIRANSKSSLPGILYNALATDEQISVLLNIFEYGETRMKSKIVTILLGLMADTSRAKEAAKMVTMNPKGVVPTCIRLLESSEPELQSIVTKLLPCLSRLSAEAVAQQLRQNLATHLFVMVTYINSHPNNPEEQAGLINVLAYLPADDATTAALKATQLLQTLVGSSYSNAAAGKHVPPVLQESIMAFVWRFTRSVSDEAVLKMLRDVKVVRYCRDMLDSERSTQRAKTLAIQAIVNLSRESGRLSLQNVKQARKSSQSGGFFAKLRMKPKKKPVIEKICPIHLGTCTLEETFCLLEDNACLLHSFVNTLKANPPDEEQINAILSAFETLLRDSRNGVPPEQEANVMARGVKVLVEARVPGCILPQLERARSDTVRIQILTLLEKMLSNSEAANVAVVDPSQLQRTVTAVVRAKLGRHDGLQDVATKVLQLLDVLAKDSQPVIRMGSSR